MRIHISLGMCFYLVQVVWLMAHLEDCFSLFLTELRLVISNVFKIILNIVWTLFVVEISSSCGDKYEDDSLVGSCVILSGKSLPSFQGACCCCCHHGSICL
jgi:hypothetical protein